MTTFTSHGAVIRVALRGDRHVECYAPTALLGTPPPARARDLLARGDRRTFKLVTVDAERRIAELALPRPRRGTRASGCRTVSPSC